MKSLKIIFFLCTILFVTENLRGQSSKTFILTGKIVESESLMPLEFATISVFKNSDGALLKGDVSDEHGMFTIDLNENNVFIEIAYIGLTTQKIDSLTFDMDSSLFDMGVISLYQSAIELQDVLVLGEKNQLKFDLDKKVFNVGKDIASSSTNALDVLDQVPSVSVDPNGKISIRGSGGITILIDGKPSVIASAQQLQNILPERLEKVEVITNPSAKYDAAGIAGIINIVMKKEKDPGLEGSLTLRSNYPHDYSIGLGLRKRKSKMNAFGDIALRHWKRPRTASRVNEYELMNESLFSTQSSRQTRRSFSVEANGGFDYYFNDKNVITSSIFYEGGKQPHNAEIDYQFFSPIGELSMRQFRSNDELEYESSFEYLLSFEKAYEEENKKLKAFVKYSLNTEDNTSTIEQSSFNQKGSIIDGSEINQRTSVIEGEQMFIGQFDVEQPISENGKIEFGTKGSYRNISNEFNIEQNTNGEWSNFGNLSNDFKYQEHIYSAYVIQSNKVGKFRYQLGLRGELTNLRTELIETQDINDRDPFLNIFPSAHLSYESTNANEVQLSYSRRIDRPRFFQLNPFFSYTDNRFISIGNPDLNPMFTSSFEIGHIKTWDHLSINTSLYHRSSTNNIEDVVEVDEEGITYIQPQNLSSKKSAGFELFIEANPKKWLRLNAGVEGRMVKLKGLETSTNFTNWGANLSTRMRLPKKTSVQFRVFYVGKSRGIQGEIGSRSRLDLSVNRQFMNRKARISFSIMDILQSFQFEYEQVTSSSSSLVVERPWRRTFSLMFSYRWN